MPEERGRRGIHLSEMWPFSGGRLPSGSHRSADQAGGGAGFTRAVHCNDPDFPEAARLGYGSNSVSTTKYTVANFVPKSLFEQFRRVANLFFLVVACVSFSPLAPYRAVSILLPLVIVVGATMAKEAVEDWQRKKQVVPD